MASSTTRFNKVGSKRAGRGGAGAGSLPLEGSTANVAKIVAKIEMKKEDTEAVGSAAPLAPAGAMAKAGGSGATPLAAAPGAPFLFSEEVTHQFTVDHSYGTPLAREWASFQSAQAVCITAAFAPKCLAASLKWSQGGQLDVIGHVSTALHAAGVSPLALLPMAELACFDGELAEKAGRLVDAWPVVYSRLATKPLGLHPPPKTDNKASEMLLIKTRFSRCKMSGVPMHR